MQAYKATPQDLARHAPVDPDLPFNTRPIAAWVTGLHGRRAATRDVARLLDNFIARAAELHGFMMGEALVRLTGEVTRPANDMMAACMTRRPLTPRESPDFGQIVVGLTEAGSISCADCDPEIAVERAAEDLDDLGDVTLRMEPGAGDRLALVYCALDNVIRGRLMLILQASAWIPLMQGLGRNRVWTREELVHVVADFDTRLRKSFELPSFERKSKRSRVSEQLEMEAEMEEAEAEAHEALRGPPAGEA